MGETDNIMEGEEKSWEEFEAISLKMISDSKGCPEYPLFRGVDDSRYPLMSSLDRLERAATLSRYWRVIQIAHKHIETVTGKTWSIDVEVPPKLPPTVDSHDIRAYEFMAYLRHNGFPSPLMDWTRSPYVAAYFAFADIYLMTKRREHVSIFVCTQHHCAGEESRICSIGPSISTHRNHYLQQSEYTICTEVNGGETYFADYETVKDENGQRILTKYNIPIPERDTVLRRLDLMNVTAYSLFHSEPSLMDTLAIRELVLEKG